MWYCFILQELTVMQKEESFNIQARYARRINKFLCCDLENESVTDQFGQSVSIEQQRVVLRSTYENMFHGLDILKHHGALLLEDKEDILHILYCEHTVSSRRKIFSVNYKDILKRNLSQDIIDLLNKEERIFVKSRRKGFSAVIASAILWNGDNRLEDLLKTYGVSHSEDIMLSKCYDIKTDSIGNMESRHIVIKNEIRNSSRTLHSVKHNVPASLLKNAQKLVDIISSCDNFPHNYVLDVGCFIEDGKEFIDIVEINPITCSLCYVNNSIFREKDTELSSISNKSGMGIEYCYDSVEHPERYTRKRYVNCNYNYINDSHYVID